MLVGVSYVVFGERSARMTGCTSQGIDELLPQLAAAVVDSVEHGEDLMTFRVRAKAGDGEPTTCPNCAVSPPACAAT